MYKYTNGYANLPNHHVLAPFSRRWRLGVGLAHHETCQAHVTDFAVTSAVQHDVPQPPTVHAACPFCKNVHGSKGNTVFFNGF